MPRIMQVTMVNSRVRNRLRAGMVGKAFLPMLMMALAMFRAKPVWEQTPTMMPTQAQLMATETVDLAAWAKAS